MGRIRIHRTWWRTCEICGTSETGSGYSIHNRFNKMCCDEPYLKDVSPTSFFDVSSVYNTRLMALITQDQVNYGIAWALEGV